MKRNIHPHAIVSPSARLGEGVHIGAFAIAGDDVELGPGCVLEAHAVVQGPAQFGRDNHFYSHCVIGGEPQDLRFDGEKSRLEAGDSNRFREFSTVNRGTAHGGGVTRLGSHNLIMSYAHIGHDCQIGSLLSGMCNQDDPRMPVAQVFWKYVLNCICSSFLPPCPCPVSDDRVPLATITIQKNSTVAS